MNVYSKNATPLFCEDQLLEAYVLSEVVNIRVSEHRPFVVVKVKRLLTK